MTQQVPPVPKDWFRAGVAIAILLVIIVYSLRADPQSIADLGKRAGDFVLVVGAAAVLKWLFGRD